MNTKIFNTVLKESSNKEEVCSIGDYGNELYSIRENLIDIAKNIPDGPDNISKILRKAISLINLASDKCDNMYSYGTDDYNSFIK